LGKQLDRLPDGRLPDGTVVQLTIEGKESGKEYRCYAKWTGWEWHIKCPDEAKLGRMDIEAIGDDLERLRVGDRDPSLYEIEIPTNETN